MPTVFVVTLIRKPIPSQPKFSVHRKLSEQPKLNKVSNIASISILDLPGKCGEHQLRNQEVFYGKREQTDAGISA